MDNNELTPEEQAQKIATEHFYAAIPLLTKLMRLEVADVEEKTAALTEAQESIKWLRELASSTPDAPVHALGRAAVLLIIELSNKLGLDPVQLVECYEMQYLTNNQNK